MSDSLSVQEENAVGTALGSHSYYIMVGMITSSLCYACSCFLFLAALRASVSNMGSSNAKKLLLGLTIFMFLMDTGIFMTNVAAYLQLWAWVFEPLTDTTAPLEDRVAAAVPPTQIWQACGLIFEIINFMVSDAIIVWRAVVLWTSSRWIQGGLWVLLLGDIGVSLCDLGISTGPVIRGLDRSIWVHIDDARLLVSLGVNTAATLCIGIKAWQFRNMLRSAFSKTTANKSFAHQVLILLVELGVIFCAAQLYYVIQTLVVVFKDNAVPLTSPLSLYIAALTPLFPMFAGMYPSIVIIVMAQQSSVFGAATFVACSQANANSESSPQRSGVMSAMHFASKGRTTDHMSLRDEGSESLPSGGEKESV